MSRSTNRMILHIKHTTLLLSALLVSLLMTSCATPVAPLLQPQRAVSSSGESVDWLISSSPEQVLTISEESLTSLARQYLSPGATVWVSPHGLNMAWSFRIKHPVQVQARAILGRREQQPVVVLQALYLSDQPMPSWLCVLLSRMASDALADMLSPVEIHRIAVSEGAIHIWLARP